MHCYVCTMGKMIFLKWQILKKLQLILVLEKESFQSEKIQNDIPMYNVYFVFSDEILFYKIKEWKLCTKNVILYLPLGAFETPSAPQLRMRQFVQKGEKISLKK